MAMPTDTRTHLPFSFTPSFSIQISQDACEEGMTDFTVNVDSENADGQTIGHLDGVRFAPLCVPYDVDEGLVSLAAVDSEAMATAITHVMTNGEALAARLSKEALGVTPATSLIVINRITVGSSFHGQGLPRAMVREVKAAFAGATNVVTLQRDEQPAEPSGDNIDPRQADLHCCAIALGFAPVDPRYPRWVTAIWRADDVVPRDYGFRLIRPPVLSAESTARRTRD